MSGADFERRPDLGPSPLERALTRLLVAGGVETALWVFLYLRPGPLGAAFAMDPAHYLFHAIYYGCWAQLIVALPFLAHARFLPRRGARLAAVLQLSVTTALLLVGALDRETQRFLGMHVSKSWFATYGAVGRTPPVIWGALADDRGGAWSALVGFALVLSYPLVATLLSAHLRPRLSMRITGAALLSLLLVPTALWNFIPGGKLRQSKVCPALFLVTRALASPAIERQDPALLARAIADFQRHHTALEGDPGYRFLGAEYPLRKHYVGPQGPLPGQRPNVIVLQLETFRAKDMQSMNPELEGPAPTPFLDALAHDPRSLYLRRYYASGVPTVHAFWALHTSLVMHPTRSAPSEATTDHIEGFPAILRAHGYRTFHFTGSDPDWDSQRVWLDRWYDEVHFSPDDREQDRRTFRRAARRLHEIGAASQPFFLHISSITNHTPFSLPEPALAINTGKTQIDALRNTMHYTDDVVRELYESVRAEPWFANTVWIIVGDHGFDMGDRGESGGHENLRHETTWVPLIIHGGDPRVAGGLRHCVGSHLDIAPTILELAFVRDDHSFMGHSLLRPDCEGRTTMVIRGGNYSYETPQFSLYHAADGREFVYEGNDLVQARALASPPAALSREAAELADAYRETVRYVVDSDRVAPRPVPVLAESSHSAKATSIAR